MSSIQEALFRIAEIAREEGQADTGVSDVRDGGDNVAAGMEQARYFPKDALGVAKMFQDIREQNDIETLILKSGGEVNPFNVAYDNTLTELRSSSRCYRINFHCSHMAIPTLQNFCHIAGSGSYFQYLLGIPSKQDKLSMGAVGIGQINRYLMTN